MPKCDLIKQNSINKFTKRKSEFVLETMNLSNNLTDALFLVVSCLKIRSEIAAVEEAIVAILTPRANSPYSS